ncbi:MAG: TldD/PmbA family protein [Chloroflexota bacterium]|nr:TldD/PmbA family protein [Chloroflexota bacterium]
MTVEQASRKTNMEPSAVADQVIEMVRAAAPSAEAEVTVRTGTEALTRFAGSFIHQNVSEEKSHLALRVSLDGRTTAARLDGQPHADALSRLIDGALEAARLLSPDPDWPGLAPAAEAPDVGHWDEATATASPEDRAHLVAEFVAAGEGLETAGSCVTDATIVAFANSTGQRLSGRTTLASLDGIARTGSSDGSARAAAAGLTALDGRALGEQAARKARDGAEATDLAPGRYEVVLEPSCVANLLTFLFVYGFNGRAVEEGRSFVALGETQFDPAITIRDDAAHPDTVGVAFDAEGTPKRPLDVVRGGVTASLLHTRRTAAKAGTESTGHAVEGATEWGALPENIVLEAGKRSPQELVGSMERGLLVTDFWYTRILDPRTQVVTGLTRNGVWLVEDGRIVRPVSNLRFTQSFLEALAPGAVRDVGSDHSLLTGGFGGMFLAPSLHLASWNFTGGAKG